MQGDGKIMSPLTISASHIAPANTFLFLRVYSAVYIKLAENWLSLGLYSARRQWVSVLWFHSPMSFPSFFLPFFFPPYSPINLPVIFILFYFHLNSSNGGKSGMLLFVRLAQFACPDELQFHPVSCERYNFISLYTSVVPHCVHMPAFLCPLSQCWRLTQLCRDL